MTTKELLAAICDANDAAVPHVAIYEPNIVKANVNRRGWTTITLQIRTSEFSPADVLDGMKAYLAIGTVQALQHLMGASPSQEPAK